MTSKPNIVFLSLDATRARNLSCYGHERETTPEIDEVAEKGTKFKRAVSVSPWTLPSYSSLFTGVPPSIHRTNSIESRLPEELVTLPELLRDLGYETIGMSSNPWLSPHFGTTRGFDEFHSLTGPFDTDTYKEFVSILSDSSRSLLERGLDLYSKQGNIEIIKNSLNAVYRQMRDRKDKGAEKAVSLAKQRIKKSDRYFLFINFLEPHLPYDPPSKFKSKFLPNGLPMTEVDGINQSAPEYNIRNTEMSNRDFEILERVYDGEINYVDSQIGRLLEFIEEQGDLENTLVVISSDHGENIGDHGLMAHHYSLHETLVRVPLILRYPGVFDGGEVVEERVSSLDIPATVAELLDAQGETYESFKAQQEGVTLLSRGRKGRKVVAEYLNQVPAIETLRAKSENKDFDVSVYDRSLRAIYDENFKLIRSSDGDRALYDVSEDYWETTNLLESHQAIAEELEKNLDSWVGEKDSESGISESGIRADSPDEHVQNRLKDLGYL